MSCFVLMTCEKLGLGKIIVCFLFSRADLSCQVRRLQPSLTTTLSSRINAVATGAKPGTIGSRNSPLGVLQHQVAHVVVVVPLGAASG